MSAETPKRFDRIVAILIQLQSRRIVKAQDLAERFEVSLRTIYRDIRTLEACGVPIISEAGVGYSIMDGYRLPPVMFTREEAGSFVAAEKLMQKFTDKSLGSYYQSAMYKIKSVLRGSEKDWVSALESQVFINPSQRLFNEDIPNALEIIFESIAERKQVKLEYRSFATDAPTERSIEPVGVFHENNFWYLFAWCHLRNDYRQFRTDRMLSISRTDAPFTREHGALDDHLNSSEPEEGKTRVRIRIDREVARYMSGGKKFYGLVEEKFRGDKVEMTFMTNINDHGLPRWFLMFGDYAEILEPPELKAELNKLIKRISEKINQPAPRS